MSTYTKGKSEQTMCRSIEYKLEYVGYIGSNIIHVKIKNTINIHHFTVILLILFYFTY